MSLNKTFLNNIGRVLAQGVEQNTGIHPFLWEMHEEMLRIHADFGERGELETYMGVDRLRGLYTISVPTLTRGDLCQENMEDALALLIEEGIEMVMATYDMKRLEL